MFGSEISVRALLTDLGENHDMENRNTDAAHWHALKQAPEIVLGSVLYSTAVDLWSLGCIIGEMISNGRPLCPGTDTLDQVSRICAITGRPTEEDIEATKSPFAASMLQDVKLADPQALSEMFPEASAEALDLMRLCLQFSPTRRVEADQALRHPYVVDFHNPDDEPLSGGIIHIPVEDATTRHCILQGWIERSC